MPHEIEDAAWQNLVDTWQTINMLSKQVGEWITLQSEIQDLRDRYRHFHNQVPRTANIIPDRFDRLVFDWRPIKNEKLRQLRNFIRGIQYIESKQQIETWLNALLNLAGDIHQALANCQQGDFKNHCDKFDEATYDQLAECQNMLKKTVDHLCTLASMLQQQLVEM